MIEVKAVGGYNKVGKNMTAVKVGEEVVIFDMGLDLDNYIAFTENEPLELSSIPASTLIKAGAIPNDKVLGDWKKKVVGIIPTHGHLDHVGALVFLSNSYKAPIICTPLTKAIIQTISKDERIALKNTITDLPVNGKIRLTDSITVEFVNVTHSIPQTVMVVLHTSFGKIMYANDFKFDNHPTLGKKPNYARLESLGKEGIDVLICDSTRANRPMKTPSEMVAREMLRDVLLGTESKGKTVIITTFASHLARLKSIIAFGKQMGRKVVFLGRSLAKYTAAGEKVGIINFSKEVEMVKFGKQIQKKLKKIEKELDKHLLVVTGHQGEPQSTLSKMVNGVIPFQFKPEDHVVFSCTVIPSEINIENRRVLEDKLAQHHVRIFKDLHASGHASREDLRDLLNMVKPKHLIPAHGDDSMKGALMDLAVEKGYTLDKTVHMIHDGEQVSFEAP